MSCHIPFELTNESPILVEYPMYHENRIHKTEEINRPKNIKWYDLDSHEVLVQFEKK